MDLKHAHTKTASIHTSIAEAIEFCMYETLTGSQSVYLQANPCARQHIWQTTYIRLQWSEWKDSFHLTKGLCRLQKTRNTQLQLKHHSKFLPLPQISPLWALRWCCCFSWRHCSADVTDFNQQHCSRPCFCRHTHCITKALFQPECMSLPVSDMSPAAAAGFYGTDVNSVRTWIFSVRAPFHSTVFASLLTHLSPSGCEYSILYYIW